MNNACQNSPSPLTQLIINDRINKNTKIGENKYEFTQQINHF